MSTNLRWGVDSQPRSGCLPTLSQPLFNAVGTFFFQGRLDPPSQHSASKFSKSKLLALPSFAVTSPHMTRHSCSTTTTTHPVSRPMPLSSSSLSSMVISHLVCCPASHLLPRASPVVLVHCLLSCILFVVFHLFCPPVCFLSSHISFVVLYLVCHLTVALYLTSHLICHLASCPTFRTSPHLLSLNHCSCLSFCISFVVCHLVCCLAPCLSSFSQSLPILSLIV